MNFKIEIDMTTRNAPIATTTTELNIRTGAGVDYPFQSRENMTPDGRAHSDGHVLRSGTRVSINEYIINPVSKQVWAHIPSGYICLINNNKRYYKGGNTTNET